MQKRRMRVGWVVVALATLVLSASVVVSQTAILEPTSSTFTTSSSRFGDVLVYDGFVEWFLEDRVTLEERNDYKVVWKVEGPNQTADLAGTAHRSVGMSIEALDLSDAAGQTASFTTTWFDEASRQPIRRELYFPRTFTRALAAPVTGQPTGPAYEVQQNATVLLYHGLWNPIQVQDDWRPALPFAYLQDRELRIGDSLAGPLQEGLDGALGGREDGTGFEVKLDVARRATIGGVEVIGVDLYGHELYGTVGFSQFDYESWSNTTFWYADGAAYPIQYDWNYTERWLNDDGTWSWNFVRGAEWLVELRPGTVNVAWGEFRYGRLPIRDPVFEKGPLIQTGTLSPFEYPVEDALRNIENDASLLEFRLWRMQNPGAQATGVLTDPRLQGSAAGFPWRIGFSQPGSTSIYTVESTRSPDGRVINRALGAADCGGQDSSQQFNPAWVPSELITVHELDLMWKSVHTPAVTERGPNFLAWGYAQCTGHLRGSIAFLYSTYGRIDESPGAAPLSRDLEINLVRARADGGWIYDATRAEQRSSNTASVTLASSGQPSTIPAAPKRPLEVSSIVATSAGISLLVILAYLYPFLQQGAFTLYSKLVRNQLLDHDLRDQLVHLIQETPGIAAPAMKRITGAGWTTIIYHLGVLSNNNLVTSVRDGRHRRYFPVGTLDHGSLPRVALLQNPKTRQVRDLVGAQPGIERAALARLLKVTPAAIRWHLRRLLEAGLVRAEKTGKLVRYYLAGPPLSVVQHRVQPMAIEAI